MAVVREYYNSRKDGVRLFINIDALTNENGEVLYMPVYDEKGEMIGKKPIPRGFYIVQNETGEKYTEAIDVENAPYTYRETNERIEEEETVE